MDRFTSKISNIRTLSFRLSHSVITKPGACIYVPYRVNPRPKFVIYHNEIRDPCSITGKELDAFFQNWSNCLILKPTVTNTKVSFIGRNIAVLFEKAISDLPEIRDNN